jgi:hypothetical protein
LRQVAAIVTSVAICVGIGNLSPGNARKGDGAPTHAALLREIRTRVVGMAQENSTWGCTRIRVALKNLGYRVGRSTIARIPKALKHPAHAQATDVVADASAGTLVGDRGRGFLHDGGLDVGSVTYYTVL